MQRRHMIDYVFKNIKEDVDVFTACLFNDFVNFWEDRMGICWIFGIWENAGTTAKKKYNNDSGLIKYLLQEKYYFGTVID